MKKECTHSTKDKKIVFQENNSKLTFLNKNQIQTTKVKVDGCEITSGLRCDYLLLAKELEYFIELKGQDINHAIKQLVATFKKLSKNPKKQEKTSFIICTRSPMNLAAIQNLQVKFKKNFSANLIVKNSPFSYQL